MCYVMIPLLFVLIILYIKVSLAVGMVFPYSNTYINQGKVC